MGFSLTFRLFLVDAGTMTTARQGLTSELPALSQTINRAALPRLRSGFGGRLGQRLVLRLLHGLRQGNAAIGGFGEIAGAQAVQRPTPSQLATSRVNTNSFKIFVALVAYCKREGASLIDVTVV
jgi:hypothetical protein